jgi:hypothetical protein
MIGVKLAGQFLELDTGTQFTFDADHPSFIDDFTQGDNGYPMDFPSRGKNEVLFGIPADLNTYERQYEFEVELYLFNNFWKKGRLVIDRPGTKKHSGYVKAGIRAFASLEKYLHEIPMGGIRTLGTDTDAVIDHANDIATKNYPDADYAFPTIRNDNFYGDENPDWEYFINRWDRTNQTFLKNVVGGPTDPINKDCLVPMPYVAAILKYIFKNEGYSITGDWLTSNDAAQDYFYSSRPLDNRGNHTARASVTGTPTMIVDETIPSFPRVPFNDDSTAPNQDPDNRFDVSAGNHSYNRPAPAWYKVMFTITYQVDAFTPTNPATTLTRLHWGLFLDSTQVYTLTGGSAVAVGGTITQSFTAILYANFGADDDFNVQPIDVVGGTYMEISILGSTIEVTDLDASSFNTYKLTMDLTDHVPNRTVKDFLQGFQIHYGCRFIINDTNKTVDVNNNQYAIISANADNVDDYAEPEHEVDIYSDNVIKSIGFDWPSDDELLQNNFKKTDPDTYNGEYNTADLFPSPTEAGKTLREIYTNQRYISKLNSSAILEWVPFADEYFDREINADGTKEIKDPFCPLLMRIYDTAMTGEVLIPAIDQQGDNPAFNLNEGRLESFRISKYLAAVALPDEEYPFSTSQGCGLISGVQISGKIQWNPASDGSDLVGSIPLFNYWMSILSVKEHFTKEFNFDSNYILKLSEDVLSYPTHQYFARILSQRKIFFKRLSFSMTADRINPTKAVFIILP